ncbi:bacteriochlorophyll 4-vinyl reductase [Jannaschia sp. EhC01]|nr:bacteriochlorophyll 4-vinyl reductase [Jannaschia sp. EhC01]
MIGPNAILQMLPVLDQWGGQEGRARILAAAGIDQVPDGTRMIPEEDAARLHRQLRHDAPERAALMAAEAGRRTADYILAHRIPRPAQHVLKALPPFAAARLLSKAISRNAWTFVGSGTLHVRDAWTFEIEANPLIAGEVSEHCLCDWHAGVFGHLYQTLVTPRATCTEVSCGAQAPGTLCRFEVRRA